MILTFIALEALVQQAAPVLAPRGTHPYVVRSQSMVPTLEEDDVVLANRSRGDCGTVEPSPGDVVIIDRNGSPWVRRVVAGPGQTVQMIGGELVIDGLPVRRERAGTLADVNLQQLGLPAELTTLWRESLGGRTYLTADFGPGQLDDAPPVTLPDDHWFTMGDSRDNAIDGRVDGPTPRSEICGVVLQVVRSADPARVGSRP